MDDGATSTSQICAYTRVGCYDFVVTDGDYPTEISWEIETSSSTTMTGAAATTDATATTGVVATTHVAAMTGAAAAAATTSSPHQRLTGDGRLCCTAAAAA